MKRETFVIYVQDLAFGGGGEIMLYGSFNSQNKATAMLPEVRKHYPNDNRFYIGIRFVNPMNSLSDDTRRLK